MPERDEEPDAHPCSHDMMRANKKTSILLDFIWAQCNILDSDCRR